MHRGRSLTFSDLDTAANRLANGLSARGIGEGTRVAVMLDNHPDLVCLFFALAKLGAVQVPVNTRLKGDPLAYLLAHANPAVVIAESGYAPVVETAIADGTVSFVWRAGADDASTRGASVFRELQAASDAPPPGSPTASHVLTVLYTSGTTGPPKGVLVTDKMHRASAEASAMAADVRPEDVMYLWEPLYHIGGLQVLVLALEHDVTIVLGDRFSASGFWREVRGSGTTQIHFLGGILQMLLAQPPRVDDRDHRVRVAWGGGAPADVWRAFEARFGVQVRESYGMTEASSLTSINVDARFGTVGRPAPWFDVRIAGDDGAFLPPGASGEILVREREPGLITPGYFRDPEATARAIRDGWLHTGDLGCLDEQGYLHFRGRLKDCVRHRGENVSAWEIERVVERLDCVEEVRGGGSTGRGGGGGHQAIRQAASGSRIRFGHRVRLVCRAPCGLPGAAATWRWSTDSRRRAPSASARRRWHEPRKTAGSETTTDVGLPSRVRAPIRCPETSVRHGPRRTAPSPSAARRTRTLRPRWRRPMRTPRRNPAG